MTKGKRKKPGKKQNPQLSFSLASTSGKKIRVSRPRGLDALLPLVSLKKGRGKGGRKGGIYSPPQKDAQILILERLTL